jgi:hypothetical protein
MIGRDSRLANRGSRSSKLGGPSLIRCRRACDRFAHKGGAARAAGGREEAVTAICPFRGQLREAETKLASGAIEQIKRRRADDGWISAANQPVRTGIDYWLHAQAVCALLHPPQIGDDDARLAADELALLFQPNRTQVWSGKKYGWLGDTA